MDDFPWIYVIMVFLAFLSYVRTKFREASEKRRRLIAQRDANKGRRLQQKQRAAKPEYNSPYRNTESQSRPQSSQLPPLSQLPNSIQDLFEQVNQAQEKFEEFTERQHRQPVAATVVDAAPATPPVDSPNQQPEQSTTLTPPIKRRSESNQEKFQTKAAIKSTFLRDPSFATP